MEKAFYGQHLRLYDGLHKAQGAGLCPARTGKIGLRQFPFPLKVPDVVKPVCPFGEGSQDVVHILVECLDARSLGTCDCSSFASPAAHVMVWGPRRGVANADLYGVGTPLRSET